MGRDLTQELRDQIHIAHGVSKNFGEFLNVAVWPGRSNPEDEVVSVQLRKFEGDWKTLARVALYRTRDGTYSELQERTST